jgi:aspartyl-tRNA(Asn)/glutamyl-tRNA(Gln) amidotransferase subunit C
MPRVTVETVSHVARLARLSLTEEERALFARQLDEILAWAESLQAVDVSDVEPLASPGADELRADAERAGLPRERALEAAPDAAEGLFRVPRVIGG